MTHKLALYVSPAEIRRWQRLDQRIEELAAVANQHTGLVLAAADEERAEIEAELADDLIALLARNDQAPDNDNDQWLARTVQFSREQWEHWRGLAERIAELATVADTYVGVGKSALSYLPLADADEERAECETELANEFIDLLGLDEHRTPLVLSDGHNARQMDQDDDQDRGDDPVYANLW